MMRSSRRRARSIRCSSSPVSAHPGSTSSCRGARPKVHLKAAGRPIARADRESPVDCVEVCQMFEGATAAIVTPFRGGQLDGPALRAVTRHLLAGGIDGIVVVGSTGEGATLTPEERRRALELVLEEAKGRAFVIAGTGTNATDSTIQLTRSAKE